MMLAYRSNILMASIPAPPKPAPHHAYKSWTTSWYDDAGQRHFKRFGKVDQTPKAVARATFDRWYETEWKRDNAVRTGTSVYTVRNLCLAYAEICRKRYVKHGKLTSHIDQVEHALNALTTLHGDAAADTIGSPEITRMAGSLAQGHDRQGREKLLSVSTVNGRIRVIKMAFKWARGQGLVSRECAVDVSLAQSVRGDNVSSKRPRDIRPVPDAILQKTLEHCPPTVADMIRVHALTGMRPGELCDMRVCDIDQTDANVWVYRPWRHKNEHHKKTRVIPIGKRAQKILRPYIAKRKINDPVFMAVEAHRERLEQLGWPKVIAYQASRSRFKPHREFSAGSYRNKIGYACDRAFDPTGAARKRLDFSHRWHPNRLRHNFATAARAEFGIEAAADVLGHANLSTTAIYAERSIERAKDVARKIG